MTSLLHWYEQNHWRVQLAVVLLILTAASIHDAGITFHAVRALEVLAGRLP